MAEPSISVVIPTYNDAALIDRCLQSLGHQRLPAGTAFETIVVDDGSTDATAEVVRRHAERLPGLRYVYLPRTAASSRGSARNAGVAAATAEVVAFLDGDQVVAGDFLARHLAWHAGGGRVVIIGLRNHQAGPDGDLAGFCATGDVSRLAPVAWTDGRFALLDRLGDDLATVWHLFFSCNVSLRADDFRTAGGYSDRFLGWGLEDSELGFRLSRSGCRLLVDPANVVYQLAPPKPPTAQLFTGWLANLNTFIELHDDAPEVALQRLLIPFFDPAQEATWLDCYERFEQSVRDRRHQPDRT